MPGTDTMETQQRQSYAGHVMAKIIDYRSREAQADSEPRRSALHHLVNLWRLELRMIEQAADGRTSLPVPRPMQSAAAAPRTRAAVEVIGAISREVDEVRHLAQFDGTERQRVCAGRLASLEMELAAWRRHLWSLEQATD